MSVIFKLEGQRFHALNGGPVFRFTPAISFFVSCKTQKEIDRHWEKLSAGGSTDRCGWLKDKYGVSWQIVPDVLGDLLQSKDAAKAARVMKAMMGMVKLDVQGLKDAARPPAVRKKRR
jgi:predicted 3-demethylubiquinone-9 3-methyltransferase (glyoxalase superfamily)